MTFSALTGRSLFLSLLLHAAAALLLVVNLDYFRKPLDVVAEVNLVQAVAVDAAKVDAEVRKLREEERREEQERERKVAELEAKAKQAEDKRKQETRELAELEKKKQQERQEREQEQERLAAVKKEQEELDKKRKAEDDERKRKEAEAAMQKQLAAEQSRADQGVINQYAARIKNAIAQQFNKEGLPPALQCTLTLRMVPGGEVVMVQVRHSSGNGVFDQRALAAVNKASPLPVPDDPRVFEKMRNIDLVFDPDN
jgi:colicin import membrane protein